MKKSVGKSIAIVLAILGGTILIVALIAFVNGEKILLGQPVDGQKVGQLGDVVGGIVGSIWALAGVILFFSALKLQTEELKEQREYNISQQEEFKKQTEVYDEQAKTQKLQRFENTFFNLLDDFREITEEHRKYLTQSSAGHAYNKLNNWLKKLRNNDELESSMNEFYKGNAKVFLPLFSKKLECILEFIYKTKIENKEFYINVIKSSLVMEEMVIAFYMGLVNKHEKLKTLFEEFQFFKDLTELPIRDKHKLPYMHLYPKAYNKE